jgi:hypothetical protein
VRRELGVWVGRLNEFYKEPQDYNDEGAWMFTRGTEEATSGHCLNTTFDYQYEYYRAKFRAELMHAKTLIAIKAYSTTSQPDNFIRKKLESATNIRLERSNCPHIDMMSGKKCPTACSCIMSISSCRQGSECVSS